MRFECKVSYEKFMDLIQNEQIDMALHRQVIGKGKTPKMYIAYERNIYDENIFETESAIKDSGVFENFPEPDKNEIARWQQQTHRENEREVEWALCSAPKLSKYHSIQGLLRNISINKEYYHE